MRDFWTVHPDARPGLRKWAAECEKANWRSIGDVKAYARSADYVGNNRIVFNVFGNKYRLVVAVHFKTGLRQKDLCPYIGSEPLVSAVMNGTRALSKAMIVNLHEGLGIPYEDLMVRPERKPSYRKVAMF